MKWMASDIGKYVQIEGGDAHSSYKEYDAAIADCLTVTKERKATMEARIVAEGCRSTTTSSPGTWVAGGYAGRGAAWWCGRAAAIATRTQMNVTAVGRGRGHSKPP